MDSALQDTAKGGEENTREMVLHRSNVDQLTIPIS